MLNEADPITKSPEITIEILGKATGLLFGLKKENLHEDLYRTTFAKISELFIGITIQDVKNAYNDAVVEKKAFTTLTRDELIQPIKDYWAKKQVVKSEFSKVEKKVLEEIENKTQRENFKKNSFDLYLQCLENGSKWTGTPMQANVFAKNFKDMFSQEIKDKVWKDAQREFLESKEIFTTNPIAGMLPPIPAEMIFSRMIVDQALVRKFKLIID